MIQTPLPTPYDIIPPAPGPLVPSNLAWILLALIAVVSILLAARSRYRRPNDPTQRILISLASDLEKAAHDSRGPELERITRLARRVASYYVPDDLTGFSSVEMRALARDRAMSDNELLTSTASILRIIAELEDIAYAPKTASREPSVREHIQELSRAINLHVRRHPAI